MDVDDLLAASRPDPEIPDAIWESGPDLSILHLDHIPDDAPKHADLGRYTMHLSGSRTEKGMLKAWCPECPQPAHTLIVPLNIKAQP